MRRRKPTASQDTYGKATAAQILFAAYGDSVNFMTPDRIAIGMSGRAYAWELSKGMGMRREDIFGVSVATLTRADKKCHELSTMFTSEAKARAYIASGFSVDMREFE